MPMSSEQSNPASIDPILRFQQLSEVGIGVEIDPSIPPKRYYRSGIEMVRMGTVYMEEGQLENAYILFHKYITLFLVKLPDHPGYKNFPANDKKAVNSRLKDIFPLAEKLKTKIKEKYAKEHDTWLEAKRKEDEQRAQELKQKQDFEAQLRRAEEEKAKFEKEKQWRLHSATDQSQKEEPITYIDNPINFIEDNYTDDFEKLQIDNQKPEMPSRDLKPLPIANESLSVPSVDRLSKPSSLLSPGQFANNIQVLRKVTVPQNLMHSFLRLASNNTDKNIETCGILAGKFSQNKFTVTHLLLPKQSGTSDSCSTDNEEDIFAYQDLHNLITLGWIHTHPSQTAFMSSVDLHTHCSYQLMMPEAIAIVCSPKYMETGIYSLTQGYGVDYIGNCRVPGFHPHPKEPPLYEESMHVILEEGTQVTIVDLR